jgi:hypothetical protein
MLSMKIMMGGPEPFNSSSSKISESGLHGQFLVVRPINIARVCRKKKNGSINDWKEFRGSMLPQLFKDEHVTVEGEPRTNGSVIVKLEI